MSSIIYNRSIILVATYFTKKHNISIIFNLLYDLGSGTSVSKTGQEDFSGYREGNQGERGEERP
jgi:hypothetical protein